MVLTVSSPFLLWFWLSSMHEGPETLAEAEALARSCPQAVETRNIGRLWERGFKKQRQKWQKRLGHKGAMHIIQMCDAQGPHHSLINCSVLCYMICLNLDFSSSPHAVHKSEGEEETPLAFSVVLHHDVGMALTQIRLLFRPHHAFCLYIDESTSQDFKKAMQGLVNCYRYRNVRLRKLCTLNPGPQYDLLPST